MKLNKFKIKLVVVVLIANKTIKVAGLQGSTIAPKKNPNKNELSRGFFAVGDLNLGNILPILTLNIIRILTIPSIPNAIGDTIAVIVVNDISNIFVNISPTANMEDITPSVTIKPSRRTVFLLLLPNCPAKYARKAGYKGNTQTAVVGANIPAKKANHRLVSAATTLTSLV